ncbi:MAG: hypothetical protein WCO02_04085 [Bacteroidota bacterium]
MKSAVSSYAKSLLIVTISAGILALALYYLLPAAWFSPALPVLFAFFYSCSLISFMILSNSIQKKFSRFTSMFMLTTAGKLFLFIAIMIIYSFLNKKDAVPFLLNFFVLYLIFTIFEVTQVVGLTKKPDATGNEHA